MKFLLNLQKSSFFFFQTPGYSANRIFNGQLVENPSHLVQYDNSTEWEVHHQKPVLET